MSNCIELRRSSVLFSASELDVPAFMAQVERTKEMKDAPEYDPGHYNEAACNDSIFWWFLSTNVFQGAGGVVVRFGRGRSTHCWRDFYATCCAINKYMKREKKHTFVGADECDGFATWCDVKVQFGPGMEPFEY